MTVELRFESGTETYSDDEILSMSPVLTHTGMGDFRITIRGDRALEDYAARQERTHIAFNGTVQWTGYITDCSHSLSAGNTTIQGEGIAKRLKETRPDYESLGGALTYSNIAVGDAIRDYWSRTEFSNVTTYNQSENLVAENELIQSASTTTEWNNILNFEHPELWDISSNSVQLKQTNWLFEGELPTASSGTFTGSNVEFSNGGAEQIGDAGDYVEYTFTIDHTIPAGEFDIWWRGDVQDPNVSQMRWLLRDSGGTTIAESDTTSFGVTGLEWRSVTDDWGGFSAPELPPDTYTIRFEENDPTPEAADYLIDVVAGLDSLTRVTSGVDATSAYTFDNDNGGNSGYLDGPELYPSALETETDIFETQFNIAASSVTSTWDDTTGAQAISVSNDGGVNYEDFTNTTTVSHDYTGAGREARVKFTLDRYGSRTTATPQTGYLTQTVDTFQHTVDLNDLAVIVDLELSKNHFDNLQDLHNKGDFVWAITHSDDAIENILVESFARGEQTKTLPVEREIDSTPEIAAKNYYNSIYLQGRLVNGTRPTSEVKDTDRISTDGREISPGVLRDLDISTEAGADYRANTLLNRATQNNALRGQKVYPARFDIVPGYSYAVSFQSDGATEEFTLEEISLRLGTNQAETTLDFVPPQDLSEDISELRRNAQQQSDQI